MLCESHVSSIYLQFPSFADVRIEPLLANPAGIPLIEESNIYRQI